ncbi:class I SAM-dependent methyltransferase [Pedobacter sp. 22163]|uniref:class I SAM-dependent methyltransferase n=1 Tax=Pedobacter sp. 22163 TaxID=3453883 RepID=UPI003F866B4B
MKSEHIQETFGNIDTYLFDQLLKGTYDECCTILDAGCGTGRNLLYFLKIGAEVYGVDQNTEAISQLKTFAAAFPQINSEENFKIAPVEKLPFTKESFDLVISSPVLHFAENQEHFEAMLTSM